MDMVDKCDGLNILEVWPVNTEFAPNGGIGISWFGDVGFGEFALFWGKDGNLHATTEYMDSAEDRRFTKKLLELLADSITIDE